MLETRLLFTFNARHPRENSLDIQESILGIKFNFKRVPWKLHLANTDAKIWGAQPPWQFWMRTKPLFTYLCRI